MSLPSSPEHPQPLGRVVMTVKEWVHRLGEIWVDAQVIEIKRRSGPTQFMTFRDRIADMSANVTVSALVLDSAGPLPEGSRVTARLRPRVWDRTTSLSFECLEIRVAGEGQLLARLEKLKRLLQAEGLFDPHRKRPLPFLPRRVGLITAKGSDAERDVIENVTRRWPAVFEVVHVPVQGPTSAEAVMRALQGLDAHPDVDVIIVARGGGSLEDLLSFSDEGVVRAVSSCRTPVISAIGHEQDYPLIDFVADWRASTPTDAAKRVVPDHADEQRLVHQARERLDDAIAHRITAAQQALDDLRSRPVMRDPTSAFVAHADRLALLRHRLRGAIEQRLAAEDRALVSALAGIRAMSPRATLERGYALLVADGRTVSTVADTEPAQHLTAHLVDGTLQVTVDAIAPKEDHG